MTDMDRLALQEPSLDTLLNLASDLTKLARNAWLTLLLGCLYVWIAIAGLHDVQLFVEDSTINLPIINVGIAPSGFFVFAPMLLLAIHIYLHLTLGKLWDCYGQLRLKTAGGDYAIDGLPLPDRVPQWLMTSLIPYLGRPWSVSRIFANFFCWLIGPITLIALSYRYLRAHNMTLTLFHCAIISLAIVASAVMFYHKHRVLQGLQSHSGKQLKNIWAIGSLLGVTVTASFFAFALKLTQSDFRPSGNWQWLTPHAQLYRQNITVKNGAWSQERMEEIDERLDLILRCWIRNATLGCGGANLSGDIAVEAAALIRERERKLRLLEPARLGYVGSSTNQDSLLSDEACENNQWLGLARDLSYSDLRQAFLAKANLGCVNFTGANMNLAYLRGAFLDGANLSSANLSFAKIEGAEFTNASLEGADLAGVSALGVNFWGANLSMAEMWNADLTAAHMARSDMSGAYAEQVDFSGATASGVNFSDANLRQAGFLGSDLRGAVFKSADLNYADFTAAAVAGADFSEAVGLSQIQLEKAFGDHRTRLPEDIARPSHWVEQDVDQYEFVCLWRTWMKSNGSLLPRTSEHIDWFSTSYDDWQNKRNSTDSVVSCRTKPIILPSFLEDSEQ